MLQILLRQLPHHPRIRHRSRHRRLRHLLHKPHTGHGTLPINHIPGLHLNHRHPRIIRGTIMDPISKVPKPSTNAGAIQFLDLGVGVRDCGCGAGYRDPILGTGVLECYLAFLAVLEVAEFLGVVVGEEVEIWAFTLGDGHGAGDEADVTPVGG